MRFEPSIPLPKSNYGVHPHNKKSHSKYNQALVFSCFKIGNLIWCSNCWIYLYSNVHNISWEHVNKFEINLMNKNYRKKNFKTL